MTKFQKLWLEALRSGKYEQGTGCLNKNSKYCCLGVACDLFKDNLTVGIHEDGYTLYDGEVTMAPPTITSMLDLVDGSGNIFPFSDSEALLPLTSLNDDIGRNFTEIADIIEKYAKYYFKNVT